jgi:hypothetical protein
VNNFVTLKENFEINPLSDREPVEVFENRSYMIPLLCSTHYPRCPVLNSLEWSNGFLRETVE